MLSISYLHAEINHKNCLMFHLYITLAYIIPNIYVFFRIKDLFISKGYRLLYFLIYLITAAIYPLTESYSGRDMNQFLQIMSAFSGYLLPFYLYLFLCILVYDLFLLLNLLARLIHPELRKSFSFRFYTLSAMIFLSASTVVAGAINLNTIRVSRYQVEVPRSNSNIDHLRIAFVADFHIQQNTSIDFVEQFVRKINDLQPELMLYGGDMMEGDSENETSETIESALRNIKAKYGVFGVTGNHEFYGGQEQGSFFRKAGITLLCDTILRIDDSFYLAGRYDQHFRNRKIISEILGSDSLDLPVILMDHRPVELQEVSRTVVDVQLSGHTHNGQLFPINLITRKIYELSWGYMKIRDTHFFVTSGLRLWGPPVKTAGKSEIMLVDILFNDVESDK
jgi:predicted MPP superfamily phosphohydrolase